MAIRKDDNPQDLDQTRSGTFTTPGSGSEERNRSSEDAETENVAGGAEEGDEDYDDEELEGDDLDEDDEDEDESEA
jgi:hypothetical protein